ncbi:hypothetical protein Patl1_22107 [Pistacia atlantica]|uniref:Uncharacterized protein n=1 Tax=Pistacia atlantica TaxID=434234 RepID=A0ACC1BHF4_9ROSI|nr:hypothetical protein Patl1_22107 [Pistacia atlantica]
MLECQKGRINTAIAITRSFFLISRTDSRLKYGNKKEKGCRLKPSHLVEKHDFNIKRDDDLKQYLPEIVDDDSVEMIMNGIWKPVDIAIATVQNNINVEPPVCNDRQRTEFACGNP